MKKELTVRAIIIGLFLSTVMCAANVYLGLKAGMTVSASIPAAVLGSIILGGLFRNGTLLEANQVQTAASAGESLAAGIIFTMPAMILIGSWEKFNYLTTTLIALTGGLLGILFMIPMRKIFVVDSAKELTYPEAVACAAVLTAGRNDRDRKQALSIFNGASIGILYKLLSGIFPFISSTIEGATRIGNRIFYCGADISPALIGVGVIVGLKVALLIGIGGVIGWLIGIPLLSNHVVNMTAIDGAWYLWSKQVRYIGVGCMALGGIVSIWQVRKGIAHAAVELVKAVRRNETMGNDLPGRVISVVSLITVLLVLIVYYRSTHSVAIAVTAGFIMVVMAFFFTAVASYIVGLVGNSNSPVSGMTITTVLFSGLLMTVFGFTGTAGMTAVLCIAAVVCCVACTAGDVCNDLKTGFLIGASPWKQQIMQIAGVVVACVFIAPILQLLHDHTPGGIGGKELPAPQAALFAGLAEGFFGKGTLRWDLVGIGAGIGMFVLIIDSVVQKQKCSFRVHLMPIAVGIYLPFQLALPILSGGIIASVVSRNSNGTSNPTQQKGVLFSSGAIAGESLAGVGIAVLAACGIERLGFNITRELKTLLSIAAAIVLIVLYYIFSKTDKNT